MEQGITHKNHYIPQFYLKNWSLDGKTIQTYSILVSNAKVPYWTRQQIRSTAVWNDFYTRIEGDKEVDDFEHWFDKEFESPTKPVFDRLLNHQKVSHEDMILLSRFIFAQYLRTPTAYLKLTEQSKELIPDAFEILVEKLNQKPEDIQKEYSALQFRNTDSDHLFPMKVTTNKERGGVEIKTVIGRGSYLYNLKRFLTHTIKVAESLNWQVIHASEDISFPTSDDPVICLNYRSENDYDFKGGWGRKNCNILMPLSPRLILFTQVGDKGPCCDLDYSPRYSRLFRQMIIQHAHRYIYADRPQKGMLALNARVVNPKWYEEEKQGIVRWHIEQIRAEENL